MKHRALGWGIALVCLAGGQLHAQGDCFPPKDSHEAQLFGHFSVPLAFSQSGPPAGLRPGAVSVGLEATLIPHANRTISTPTICRPGKGPEHTNLLPGLLRPRVSLGLPAGFSAEVAWIPPIRVSGVRANLVGLALGNSVPLGPVYTLALRAEATLGEIRAPITCDTPALNDPNSECFQGTKSDDSYHPNILGVEATVGRRMAGGRVGLYAGVGYNRLMPRFRVNFTNRFGDTDRRRVEVDLDRLALSAGAGWMLNPSVELAAEVYTMPADAVTGRVMLRGLLGKAP